MPHDKNPAVGRSNKNYDPKYSAKGGPSKGAARSGSAPGSKSPGHRGHHDDAAAPKKARWNAGERADRAAGRPSNDRPAYGDDRPAYGQRSERPAYGDRPNRADRPAYNNDRPRTDRPAYNADRPRADRPAYNNDRPSYNGAPRTDRPTHSNTERPSYNDRARADRPAYNNDRARTDRPAYNNDRPSYGDRAPRTDRPAYNNDRPRTDRPAYGDRAPRTDRPAYNNDRPSYGDRSARSNSDRPSYGDRPARSNSDRPSYGDRPARSNSDRPNRSHDDGGHSSNFYPSRDTKAHFAAGDDVVLERLEAIATTAAEVVGVTFGDLGLGENIVRELATLGAATPFPIQAATIPDVLAGRDVLGRGKTGSGKTIAFGAPLVEKLLENNGAKDRKMARKPRALILAPTRELALQIDRTIQPIARSVGLFTTQIYGGVPQYRQVSALQRGVDIIIGTAGRIEDLIEQGRLDLSEVVVTVLDEADYMCDLGFLEPVQRILRLTKKGGQKLLFSATLDKGVAQLVKEFLTNPAVHEVAGEDQASSTIDHRVLMIEHRDKSAIIGQLVDRQGKTLIFSRTRAYAEQLAEQLEDAGVKATSLHGDLNQARRTRNLQMLTSGRVNVLVATDVAARGIHVDDIDLVIQADAPDEYKTYLHRSGRTGRAGKSGTVVTLIPKQRRRRMDELLGRAEIEASFTSATPGDSAVSELAGI